MQDKIKEIWKDAVGYEGIYQVSNLGRAKSLQRFNVRSERILKYRPNNRGYNRISFTVNGKSKDYLIHRLVAKAFLPNPNNLDTVDHIDNNKDNNCVDNLRWMSNLDNWKRSNMGENNSSAKITKEQVIELRKLSELGCHTRKELCIKFSLSKAQISSIINKKSWKDE